MTTLTGPASAHLPAEQVYCTTGCWSTKELLLKVCGTLSRCIKPVCRAITGMTLAVSSMGGMSM